MLWKKSESPQKYFRPLDRWECGRLRSGLPCPSGPDHRGHCPFHRNQQEASEGTEEKSCRPRRALWWRRRRIARGIGLLFLGLLLLMFAVGLDQEFSAPGELSSPHAQILSRQSNDNRCASCHEINASESVAVFLSKSFSGHAADRGSQTLKCLECHRQEMPQGHLRSPHDLTIAQLEKVTEAQVPAGRFTTVLNLLPKQSLSGDDLACSQCHKEHQGRFADLKQISSQKCQACHTNRFDSFTHGHPEFTNYPLSKQSAIQFNHQSHLEKHFSSKNQLFDCRSCHFDATGASGVGPVNRAVSFEKACASCHEKPLRSSFSDGLLVIQLPSLDRERIEAAGLQLGAWPAEASLMADGKLSPLLKWLLMGNEKNHALLWRMPASGALNDLKPDDPASLQLQVDLAQSIRTLVRELAEGGQPAMQSRFTKAIPAVANKITSQIDIGEMEWARGASPDIFRKAWEHWFEDSQQRQQQAEVGTQVPAAQVSFGLPTSNAEQKDPPISDSENRSKSVDLPAQDPLAQEPVAEESSSKKFSTNEGVEDDSQNKWSSLSAQTHLPQGGWMLDETRLAIVYIPHDHSDPLVTAWLDAAARHREDAKHFDEMLQPKAMATCTECHNLKRDGNWSARIRESVDSQNIWQADSSPVKTRGFTRFNHAPHLTLPQLSNCISCHRSTNEGMFEPIQLSNCAECHTAHGAGNSCTQCHNYHILIDTNSSGTLKSR